MSYRTRFAALGLALALLVVPAAQSAAAQDGDRADLALTKIADRKEVRRDQNIVFVATVTNLGPDSARDITFTDSLPDQLNGIDAACVFPDGAIVPTPRPDGIPSRTCDCRRVGEGRERELGLRRRADRQHNERGATDQKYRLHRRGSHRRSKAE